MAYTSIHAIKSTLVKALDYIENPEKTDDQLLVSGYNVDPLTASMEFTMTRVMAKNMLGERGGKKGSENLAYHLIQSFSPEDNVTPEQAHELGRRLANELLEGKYEYVISTHVDKDHVHNHIIFNAASFYDFRKFRTQPFKTAAKIRTISDRICAEADLSVIRTPAQLGRSYQYKSLRYGPSWKRQIRRRLQFVLQAAGSYKEFLDGAERLGITVDASGKYVTYRMEGQERATRDRTLDKDGAFSVQGIEAQIEANTGVRERLKQAIREAAAGSADCREFQAELQRRGIEAKQTRRSGTRYTVDGETVVWEWTLGPAYSTEAIQAALGHPEHPLEDRGSALDDLEKEFQKTSRDASREVGVELTRRQVVETTAEGVLVSVPDGRTDAGRLIFIDHNHVAYHKETDSFTAYLGSGYEYYVGLSGGERIGERVRGENILRALELQNGVQPVWLEIGAEDIKAMSPKGLTLSIPELGIESLFLEDQFVAYERTGGGSVRAAVYEHWSYAFRAADGSARYVSGSDLSKSLEGRQTAREGSLPGRINAMQRRGLLAKTRTLTDALLLMRREGIRDMGGFEARLDALRSKQQILQGSIQTIKTRNAAYQAVAKQLVTYHDYLPIKLRSMELSGKARRSYEATHEGELSAWSYAEKQLEKCGVQPEADPEKVLALVKEQERELAQLKAQADRLAAQAETLERARDELRRVQEEGRRPERSQDREQGQER